MYLVVDDWIFISTFNAFVIPNSYEIQPFYVTDLGVNQLIELPLYITNPSATDTMIIEELYSTDEDVKLKWPHSSVTLSEKSQENINVMQHILVQENARKMIASINLEFGKSMDVNSVIHIKTSHNDVIRVPVYIHVNSDIVKFTPSVLDFGLAPLNFDIMRISLFAKVKGGESLIIEEVMLPLSDGRLDFQMVDINKNNVIKKN